jgi:hypothetical protein
MPGTTRMRIRIKYYGAGCGNPCNLYDYGEVEDYSVSIDEPFTGPAATNDVNCLMGRLPGPGPSAALNGYATCNNPTGIMIHPSNGRFKNSLLSQTITLGLNLKLDERLGDVEIEEAVIITAKAMDCSDPFSGFIPETEELFEINEQVFNHLGENNTISDLYNLANLALSGEPIPGLNLSQIAQSVKAINESFNKCRVLLGFESSDAGLTEIRDHSWNDFEMEVYPNPTSGVSSFRFQVSGSKERITLKIYNLHGKEVATVLNKWLPAGEHVVRFDTKQLPAGIYLIQKSAISNQKSEIGKLVVMK